MSRASIEEAIPSGALIILDSSAILAYLVGRVAVSPAATYIIDELVRPGRNPAAISTVTVTETLTRPFMVSGVAVDTAVAFLAHFPNLRVVAVDFDVAREAARVRSRTGLRTPDALVLATALMIDAHAIVANDARWRTALAALGTDLQLCHLDGHLPM